MKFSEHWLRTLCDPAITTAALADVLTFGGVEVELIEPAAPPFGNVVVGEVLTVTKHPDADRLNVCAVNAGAETLTIVCGAPNVRAGMKVPLARIGAELPGGLFIKKAKVRGVESHGMLCSAKELGLSEEAAGLLPLDPSAAPGTDVRAVLDLDDRLFTTKLTPNRGDCLSLAGLAREVAALTGAPLTPVPASTIRETIGDTFPVEVADTGACPRYCGRLVRGVDAQAATPEWMVRRLVRSGLRSIGALVDITNYVLLELGQPLHAFDANKLKGGITVRRAGAGESLTLLNGEMRRLDPSFLVIADRERAVALAGIMGGSETAVDDGTTDVFIESAYFDPDVIAGKSRVLGFGSDSSYRFERGVDFAATRAALDRATELVLAICGGQAGPVSEALATLPARNAVRLRVPRVERILGIAIPAEEAARILTRLGCRIEQQAEVWQVTPPAWRFDIAIEEDLIEELARVHGYERIPEATARAATVLLPLAEGRRSKAVLRQLVAGRDYQEVVTYSFIDAQWESDFCGNSAPVALANPIASQMNVMRSSLMPGLVDVVAFNVRHKQPRIRVFEMGRCFLSSDEQTGQPWRVGGAAFGLALPEQWGVPARRVDFYDVKADVEAMFAPRALRFEPAGHPALHPGKSAKVFCDGVEAGWIGELHPRWQQKYDLPAPVLLFELALDVLEAVSLPVHGEVTRFPPVRRDMAAIFDESVPVQAIMDALEAVRPAVVTDVSLFDVYRGADLGKGKKSLAFRVLLQDTRKTLTDAEVDPALAELRNILLERFNAKLR